MKRKIAIVGYAQTRHESDAANTREGMVFEVAKGALDKAGITREAVDTVINVSSDYQDGRTISNLFLVMAEGAYLKDESKVEMDGAFGVLYAMMRILSGNHDTALVVGVTQGSIFSPHQISFYTLDPTFDRQIGLLNDVSASAIQARMYKNKYGVSDEQIALVSVKNLVNAATNPYAHRKISDLNVQKVLDSKLYYDPIRELNISPVSDGACAVVLASEEKAKEITDAPVWIKGVGSCQDSYLRDRDLLKLEALEIAAKKAYEMAGLKDPFTELNVAEVTERFSHEELMIYEALGLTKEGEGKILMEKGVTERKGQMPVNPSGGALGADPVLATGLVRMVEAAKQIRSEAGEYQIQGVRQALAHGQTGLCAQSNIVFILEGES